MGTTLTGTTPANTYDSLIKVTDNGPLSGTAKYLSDGLGNDSVLALSTAGVGIGTTSSSLFGTSGFGRVLGVVASSGYATVQIGGATGEGGEIDLGAGSIRHGAVASINGSHLAFFTNSTNSGDGVTERMRITSAGRVGIGTTTPVSALTVVGTTTSGITIQSSSAASNGLKIFNDSTTDTASIVNHYSGPLVFGTANTERMRIDSAGNVGIGTSAPDVSLTVKTGSNAGISKIYSDANGAVYSSNGDLQFFTNNSAYAINFFSANKAASLLKITDGGNVGIGTSSPYSASGFTSLDINGTNGSLLLLRTSGTTNLSIGTSVGNPTIKAEAGKSLSFYTDSTQVANITSNGITFGSDTAAANALDDYEEGTFTATLQGTISDPTTPVTKTGNYTKIGRMVIAEIQMDVVDTTGASGSIYISGLPFTSTAEAQGSVFFDNMGTLAAGNTAAVSFINVSGTSLYLYGYGSNSSWSPVAHNAGVSRSIRTTITYFAS